MKRFLSNTIPLLVLLAVHTSSFAQSARKLRAMQQKEDELTSSNLQKHINILSADSLEGRRTGTNGEAKAVRYIVSQYQKLHITPADNNKDYLQDFEIDEGKIIKEDSKLLLKDEELQLKEDWFPMAWSAGGRVKGSAALALHENGLPWWVDIKEALENNAGNPHFLLDQYLKDAAADAAKKGATALFIFNSSGIPDSLHFNPKDKSASAPIPVIYCNRNALNHLNIDAESFPYIDLTLGFSPKKRTGHNVIAWINNGAANTIVLGAHHDHLGYGEDENSRNVGEPAIHNGADDNASGTAAILELARKLKAPVASGKKSKNQLPYNDALKNNNYLFINFSGEELGLFGSKYFVEHPTIELSKIKAMINLDMVGRLNDSNTVTIGGIGTSPAWSRLLPDASLWQINTRFDSSGSGPSDHTSFYRKDIPVLFFFTGLHSDYHKPGDDADKINFPGETRIINYIMGLLGNLSNPAPIAFTKTREQTMTGTRYKVSIGIMPDYTFTGPGVRADAVIEGRPAIKAGLLAGDIIIKLGEFEVSGMETYMQALNKFEKGQTTSIQVKRGNETKKFEVTF